MDEKRPDSTGSDEQEFLNEDSVELGSDEQVMDEGELAELMEDDEALREFVGDLDEGRSSSAMKFVLFAIVLVVGVYVMYVLYPDMMYFFANKEPIRLGFVDQLKDSDLPPSNTYVSIIGIRHIERLELRSLFKDRVLFPFIGTDRFFVVADSKKDDERLDAEGLAERAYTGRLMRIGDMPYYEKVYNWYLTNRKKEIPPDTLILEDGVRPQDMKWVLVAWIGVGLALLWTLWRMYKMISSMKSKRL